MFVFYTNVARTGQHQGYELISIKWDVEAVVLDTTYKSTDKKLRQEHVEQFVTNILQRKRTQPFMSNKAKVVVLEGILILITGLIHLK